MKKIISLCLITMILSVLPVTVPAAPDYVLWNFEEDNAQASWKLHLAEGENWQEHFSFGVSSEGENHYGSFIYTNPEKGSVIRYKRSFDTEAQISPDGYSRLACKVKLSGDNVGTYQLRLYSASDKQEILMGFSTRVSVYKSHNPVTLESPVYCEWNQWHDVEIFFSHKDKAMLHYFDGKPVSGQWIPLYTNSDGSQFAGPYNNLQIVSYADYTSGTQEFMVDDISFSEVKEGFLLSSSPSSGSENVNPSEPLKMTFNQYIDEASLSQATALINGTQAAVKINEDDGKTLVIIPAEALEPARQYTVSLSGLRDITGSELNETVNFETTESIYVKEFQITQSDAYGNDRDVKEASLLGGEITAEILLGNESGAEDGIAAVMALYEDERMVRCSMSDLQTVSSENNTHKFSMQFEVTESEARSGHIKMFVFSRSNLAPLMNKWESRKAVFVSPQGSDSNSGEYGEPYKTLAGAVHYAKAGDVIIFEDGTYEESEIVTFEKGGRENAPIVLRAENKGQAKIIFKSSENERLKTREKINIPRKSGGYITIEDLIITQDEAATASDNTTFDIFINCRADNCSFIENEIYHCFEEPVKAAGVKNILVKDNILYDSVHEGIDFVNVADSTIVGNTVSEIERIAVMVKGGSRNIKVYNNTVYNESKVMDVALSIGGSTDSLSTMDAAENTGFEGYNQYFWNNVVYVTGSGGIGTGILFEGAKDSMAFNNTISGSDRGIILTNAPGIINGWKWNPINVNPKIYNNLIVNANVSGIAQNSNSISENLVSDCNMYYNCMNASDIDGENSFVGTDPMFANPGAGDFRIRAGSPAEGAGMPVSKYIYGYGGAFLQLDIKDKSGTERGAVWSIGAYQPLE